MSRYSYPHTIDNGAGEQITFHRRLPGANGDRLEGENVVKPGAGPPMHVHHGQDEVFTVRDGRIGYQRAGGPEQFAGPGETVAFKAGEAHRFWNAGTTDLVCMGYVEPADNVEYLLTELFASAKRSGGKRIDPFDAAFLMRRYRSEYTMLEIPPLIRNVVFPVLVGVGSVLGRYRRFADAPEAVARR
jgi:quercetin dioxygenase-like cupin family protein